MLKGIEPRINVEHALHVLEIIEAARKSSATGMKIKLQSTFHGRWYNYFDLAKADAKNVFNMTALYCARSYFLFILVFLFAGAKSFSQFTVGKIISYKKVVAGIEGKTDNAIFDVHVYNDNIIRVRVSKNKTLDNFSYALVDTAMPSFNNVTIEEKGNMIALSTKAIVAEIEREPFFKITFKNKNGNVINEDVAGNGFGTSFTGDKVSIYKKLQEGERFVGMGEALGNLDRRGSGITLNNTDNYKYGDPRVPMYSSIPFYIGIHHNMLYGMFFNNSFKSFFNFGLSTPFASVNFDGGEAGLLFYVRYFRRKNY